MTDNEEAIDPEDLPPVRLQEDMPIQLIGFEEELARRVGNEVGIVVRELSRYRSLNNLVGVTVAHDYVAALAGIDRGFGEGAPPPQATNDEELGHGSAMAVSVNRDDTWKTHVVFGPYLVDLLASKDEIEQSAGTSDTVTARSRF